MSDDMVKVMALLLLFVVARIEVFNLRMLNSVAKVDREVVQLRQRVEDVGGDVMQLVLDVTAMRQKMKVVGGTKVTGYSNDAGSVNVRKWRDGKTATGRKARVGLCAADWSVFPVGTLIFIEGYGWCEVQDRGGAVRGRHVDLFFPTRKEALDWGVKKMDVVAIEVRG